MDNDRLSKLMEFGGPAFPLNAEGGDGSSVSFPGMTLRDLYAAVALHGLSADIGSAVMEGRAHDVFPMVAKISYGIADAMLEERTRGR